MPTLSLSSVYMAVIFSNLLILLLYLIFRNHSLLANSGNLFFFIVMGLMFFRFIYPFQFSFSKNVYLPKFISKYLSSFQHPFIPFFNWTLSVWNIVEMIWVFGILIGIINYLHTHKTYKNYLLKDAKFCTYMEPYVSILEAIYEEHRKDYNFTIVEIPFLQSPTAFGIFKKYILLPPLASLTQRDLPMILRHEAAHFYNHDLFLKFLIQFLCIVYWWNPFSYLMRHQVDTLLEMRVDQRLTENTNPAQKVEYLNCLINMVKNNTVSKPSKVAISFCSGNHSMLTTRFQVLLTEKNKAKKYRLPKGIILCVISLLFVLSIQFVFEASYMSPEEAAGTFSPTAENSYFIKIGNNLYELYYNGELLETVSSLEYYDPDIKIYDSKEDLNKKE